MRKQFLGLAILFTTHLAFGNSSAVMLSLSNYTNSPGTVVLGTSPATMGPGIGINGATVQWSPTLNGKQTVGLQVGPNLQLCYVGPSVLLLNSAAYQGDTITIIYGQQQIPTGIACSCIGSACSTG